MRCVGHIGVCRGVRDDHGTIGVTVSRQPGWSRSACPGVSRACPLGSYWRARRDSKLLTPRFVVWCSIGRVLDSRLIPVDGSPPRNETMRHEPDRHSPALDFERSRLNRMRNPNSGGFVNAREIETLGSYVVAAFATKQLILL